jgi:methylmalonyl-CoA mutase
MAAPEGPFAEFPPVSAEEWRTQLKKDLKGEPIESLYWKNENGFDVLPFYTAGDLHSKYEPAFTHPFWVDGVQASEGADDAEANREFLTALNRGASALFIDARGKNLQRILKDVQLHLIELVFTADLKSINNVRAVLDTVKEPDGLNFSIFPVGLRDAKALDQWLAAVSPLNIDPLGQTICIDLTGFSSRGALPYYELALMLSQLVAWLDAAGRVGLKPVAPIAVRTAVDTQYFTSIAKLRAMRRLWAVLRSEFGLEDTLLRIIAETSLFNKSAAASENNLIRTTVEAMAAVTGGCNTLLVRGHDYLTAGSSEANRLAHNQQLVLNHESNLSGLIDVACGSFYVENYTDQLASQALETFKRFESHGGFFECLSGGLFEKEIGSQNDAVASQIANGKKIVVGVNQFVHDGDAAQSVADAMKKAPFSPVLKYESTVKSRR